MYVINVTLINADIINLCANSILNLVKVEYFSNLTNLVNTQSTNTLFINIIDNVNPMLYPNTL